jgi:hypothetical protein
MARFLCWHIQEQAFGGLDPEIAKHLDGLAQGIGAVRRGGGVVAALSRGRSAETSSSALMPFLLVSMNNR